ncbi:hypothetical protein T10_13581 [Trichinella papuae]|uniref:Uncharacterized protein n=1 Tax=Trichinella papuae TaxID=268474 RepID=A0A0V1M3U9_9BILA|nr:hypothetical protein T10_13581 [Trichinella papuae]
MESLSNKQPMCLFVLLTWRTVAFDNVFLSMLYLKQLYIEKWRRGRHEAELQRKGVPDYLCYLRNQTWNSRHSVYYATLLALISLKWQRLLTLSIIFFSGTFKKHQRHPKYVSLASAEKHWILSAAPFI